MNVNGCEAYFSIGESVRYNGNQIYTVVNSRVLDGVTVYDIQPEGEPNMPVLKNIPEDDLGGME